MITCDDINGFFSTYRANLKECLKWDDRIFSSTTKEEWLDIMEKRSFAIHEIYQENEAMFSTILDPLVSNSSTLTDAQYDIFLTWLKKLYYSEYDEPFFLRTLTHILIPYYEKKGATEELLFLYTCGGYANIEISQTFDQSAGIESVLYYKKVISYKDEIETFSNPLSRDYIFIAYANLISVEPLLGGLSLEEAYSIWQELCSIRSRKKFCQYDTTNPRIPDLVSVTIDSFIASGFIFDIEELYKTSSIRPILDQMTKTRFLQMLTERKNLYKCNTDLVINYYLVLQKENEITWDECWQLLDDFYLHQVKHIHQQLEPDLIGFYFVFPIVLIEALNHTSLPHDLKDAKRQFYIQSTESFLRNFPAGLRSFDFNHAVQRFAFHPIILESFHSQNEKEEFIFRIILSRHLNTLTHSVMVENFAETITNYILIYLPEILCSAHSPIKTKTEVLTYKNELLDYIRRAALLHDIGKNALTDIINTQHRKISDAEFAIIKSHPQKGAYYLSRSSDFEIYQAVALGHHRSYDGKSGYPTDFDNRNSMYAPVIDLIRICDCLDAATDSLSRYYHTSKTFYQVVQEFKAGKGTQYNPDIVDLILDHPDLYEELCFLANEGREEIYYKIYQQFIR